MKPKDWIFFFFIDYQSLKDAYLENWADRDAKTVDCAALGDVIRQQLQGQCP